MEILFGNYIGIAHTIFAVVAMITGIWVILQPKGGRRHRQIGYLYVGTMLLMLVTAFGIYRLFGGFGIFHFFAVLSFLTLMGGMYPAIRRYKNWLPQHYRLMCWSVAGLYAAFVAEVATRLLPVKYFGLVVGLGSALVIGVSAYLIYGRHKYILEKYKKWA